MWLLTLKSGNMQYMGIEDFIKKELVKREARGESPAFCAEMAKENAGFEKILNSLGSNAFDAGVTILLKTPVDLFLNLMKAMYSKKYSMSDYGKDAFKLFFGKDGIAHSSIKVVASAVHLAGQGAKIGIRQLFKL
jgi:hypothetical protein